MRTLIVRWFAVGLCALGASVSAGQVEQAAGKLTLRSEACPGIESLPPAEQHRVRCGWLDVDAKIGSEGGQSIAVAVIDPRQPTHAEPIVYFEGGPGIPAVKFYGDFLKEPYGPRQIVLFDPRGVGLSRPRLCPEVPTQLWAIHSRGLDLSANRAARLEAFRQCRDRLVARAVDFSSFDSRTIVRDVEALRQALGIARWSVGSVSFGGRPALLYVQTHPEVIRAAILDSPYAPHQKPFSEIVADFMHSIRKLDALCAKDPGCVTRWGSLEKGVVEVAEQSAAQPIAVPRQGDSGSTPFLLSTASAVFVIQQRVYDEGGLATLPLLINRIRAREGKALVPRVDSLQRSYDTMNHDVFTATECYESFPFDSVADYERNAAPWPALRRVELIPIGHLTEICPMWSQAISTRAEPLPAATPTSVPVLVGAGEFDPVIPVESSRKLASALHARLVEFPFGSHGVFYSPCGEAVQQAFLDHPQAESDVTCISRLEPLRFDMSAVLTPGVK